MKKSFKRNSNRRNSSAGSSKRLFQRSLRFEPLEELQLLSASPTTSDFLTTTSLQYPVESATTPTTTIPAFIVDANITSELGV